MEQTGVSEKGGDLDADIGPLFKNNFGLMTGDPIKWQKQEDIKTRRRKKNNKEGGGGLVWFSVLVGK